MGNDLYLNTTNTISGIKPIFWFIPVRDVVSTSLNNQGAGVVTLVNGKQWNTAKGTKFKRPINTRQGGSKLFSISFSAAIAHLSPALEGVLQQHTGAEGFLIIYEDLNGYRWLLGTKKQPLRLRYNYGSGAGPGNGVGVSLSFTGNITGSKAKYEYTDAVDAGPIEMIPSVAEFPYVLPLTLS